MARPLTSGREVGHVTSGWCPSGRWCCTGCRTWPGAGTRHCRSSPEILIGTPEGIIKAYAIRRLSEVDQWDGAFIRTIRGSPEQWQLDSGSEPQMVEIEDAELPGGGEVPAPRVGSRAGEKRSMYLSRRDFERHGHTAGCPGCVDIASGRVGPVGCLAPHTQACRKRMEAAIKVSDPERWARNLRRRLSQNKK